MLDQFEVVRALACLDISDWPDRKEKRIATGKGSSTSSAYQPISCASVSGMSYFSFGVFDCALATARNSAGNSSSEAKVDSSMLVGPRPRRLPDQGRTIQYVASIGPASQAGHTHTVP